jgi:hypothetical protein
MKAVQILGEDLDGWYQVVQYPYVSVDQPDVIYLHVTVVTGTAG